VEEWFSTKATREQRDEVMQGLAGLDTGTAIICSAHPSIRLFEKCKMRLPDTFDSSATPTIGEKKLLSPKKLATPDLEKIRERMADTIRKTEEEDPRKLKQLVATLRRELAQKDKAVPVVKETVVEKQVMDKKLLTRFEKSVKDLVELGNKLNPPAFLAYQQPKVKVHIAPPVPRPVRPVKTEDEGKPLGGGERKILIALAQYPHGKSKRQLGVLTGYASGGGAFNNYLSALRARGYIHGRDHLQITDSGVVELGDFQPLPTGTALQDHWLAQLGQAERSILQVLIAAYPNKMDRETIAQGTASYKADGEPYASSGGGFNNAISRLKTLELVQGERDSLQASDTLFDQ
jgi:hypothetical protein